MRNVIFMFIHYFSFLVGLLSLSIHLVVYTFDVYRYANNFYISALLLGIAGCIAVFTIGHNAFFLDDKLLNKYKSHGDGFMPPISAFNFVRIAFFWIAVYISWMTEFHMEILAKLPRVVG